MLQTKLEKNLNFEFYEFWYAWLILDPRIYYLIYKNLAKKFHHDEVFILIGLKQRFDRSNNYEKWKNSRSYFASGSERVSALLFKKVMMKNIKIFFTRDNAVKREYFLSASVGFLNEIKNFFGSIIWSL